MERRRVCMAAVGAALLLAGCGAGVPRHYDFSLEQLQAAVAKQFPRQQQLAGVVELQLQPPQLRLLPAEQRIAADVPLQAGGPLLRRTYPGTLALDFALGYDAATHSLVAQAPRLQALRIEGAPERVGALLERAAAPLVAQIFDGAPLYRLRAQDVQRLDAAGLTLAGVEVQADGLRVRFAPRP